MGVPCRVTSLALLWVSHLLLLPAAHRATNPRIITFPGGEQRFPFNTSDGHVVLYHEENTTSVYIGAVDKLYYYNFETSANHTESFAAKNTEMSCGNHVPAKNYLTLLEKYEDKLLICGTNDCNPTCWNWVDQKKVPSIDGQGLAPFGLDPNAHVLIDGKDIYSTIKKHLYNGRIPRFRRIRGSAELYTSDNAMRNPQFVKAAVVKQDQPYNDKIYYFFREDNLDWLKNTGALMNVSRVAQLCKGDKGGIGSLSAAKWTTFLKATLLCFDPATDRHFNRLQDVFIVESDTWSETKVYGLFLNEWDYSAVCVYSVGDMARLFQTSPLKGYRAELPTVRPGQCIEGNHTPQETFRVAESHPELEHKMKQQDILFHSKHHYQKIGVHQVQAADGSTHNVLFLATDKGTIHKVAELLDGTMNILEIQPFGQRAVIKAMTLDNVKNELFVASTSEVVRLPMAMCGAYKDDCESCVLARDPYCGWSNGKCTSVYARDELRNGTLLQALTHEVPSNVCASSDHSNAKENDCEAVMVAPSSRYYLNCSVESHHADHAWVHRNRSIHCGAGHRNCTYFIDEMTDQLYGNYSCVSQEGPFKRVLVTVCLVKPPEFSFRDALGPTPNGWATSASLSFWLGLLQMGTVFLLIQ
ncbi:semaphorin-7A [Hemicordylus capensis]|uniref:semaphorin-7A n=1 Tax=Hemicordylus capensis TaxID=884348 RepID=UPI00230311DD|nr:semaphorin-7A [Hemicordylus capensis]